MICESELLISLASFFCLIFEIMFKDAIDCFCVQLHETGGACSILVNKCKPHELVTTENTVVWFFFLRQQQ